MDKKLFINRELSWLDFNQRVVEEAEDPSTPLMEQLKFISIAFNNLDEFFMVRVGGLHLLRKQGKRKKDASGMTPTQQLKAISARTHAMFNRIYNVYSQQVAPALETKGMRHLHPGDLTEKQTVFCERIFEEQIYPLLSPFLVSSREEFPRLKNCKLYCAVRLRESGKSAKNQFAVIPVEPVIKRFVVLPGARKCDYILVEDIIRMFCNRLFEHKRILEFIPFRITLNADLELREDLAHDLLREMENVLDQRKESDCIRLEIDRQVSGTTLNYLKKKLHLDTPQVYLVPGAVDMADYMEIATGEGFEDIKYNPWPPLVPPCMDMEKPMFKNISANDILLCHPYESFEPVVKLIQEASEDSDVLAIKQILYRTSRNSPIVQALEKAALNGKSVTVIVELKARFDEARNIDWARRLERAGAQVIYGIKNLKTHAKLCMIIRREPSGIVKYMHFGTGNYNDSTARLYSDISYMTRDEELGSDASRFLNSITGYSQPRDYKKISAAPLSIRETVLKLIDDEAMRKKQGQDATIMAKVNSLVDSTIIRHLYDASKAGVNILLNVRGICCLRPGIKGVSDNIRVVSILDRFLEHSRIFYFYRGGAEDMYISSADWMPRNLDKRIELLVPVENQQCKKKLIKILDTYFRDLVKARELMPDGTYVPLKSRHSGGRDTLRSQLALYRDVEQEIAESEKVRRTVFKPYRPAKERK